MEVRVFSAAPTKGKKIVSEVKNHNKINKEQFSQDYLTNIQQFLNHENKNELLKYIKEIHNADLAEIIQNLDDVSRKKFINNIKNNFLV